MERGLLPLRGSRGRAAQEGIFWAIMLVFLPLAYHAFLSVYPLTIYLPAYLPACLVVYALATLLCFYSQSEIMKLGEQSWYAFWGWGRLDGGRDLHTCTAVPVSLG
jgi:hypothetical protein